MDKGQHLRLVITDSSSNAVVALAKDLTIHFSASTENSTTKDSSDGTGVVWDEFEVTQRSGDIQFGALVGVGTDGGDPVGGLSFADWIGKFGDTLINWKVAFVSGTNNRVIGKELCHGQGKLTNLSANPQAGQATVTYQGTLNMYGAVTVGTD